MKNKGILLILPLLIGLIIMAYKIFSYDYNKIKNGIIIDKAVSSPMSKDNVPRFYIKVDGTTNRGIMDTKYFEIDPILFKIITIGDSISFK